MIWDVLLRKPMIMLSKYRECTMPATAFFSASQAASHKWGGCFAFTPQEIEPSI